MSAPEIQEGVANASLVASFIGSVIGLSYAPKMNKLQGAIALLTGWAVAVYGAPLFVFIIEHHFNVDMAKPVEHSINFFSGLVALRLVPVILFQVEQLKDVKFFDRGDK